MSEVPEHLVLDVERASRHDLEGRLPVVFCGKSITEWYSLYCRSVLRLAESDRLLRRAYDGMLKEHWAEGESESEVLDAILSHLENNRVQKK